MWFLFGFRTQLTPRRRSPTERLKRKRDSEAVKQFAHTKDEENSARTTLGEKEDSATRYVGWLIYNSLISRYSSSALASAPPSFQEVSTE